MDRDNRGRGFYGNRRVGRFRGNRGNRPYFRRDDRAYPYPQEGRSRGGYSHLRRDHFNERHNRFPVEFDNSGSKRGTSSSTHHLPNNMAYEAHASIPMDEIGVKIDSFLSNVRKQQGPLGRIVFLGRESCSSITLLHSALEKASLPLQFTQTGNIHSLLIDKEIFMEGTFSSKQEAKISLAEMAVNKLKEECFFIIKRDEYEEVNTTNLNKKCNQATEEAKPEETATSAMEGSKAHQMMLKMGWKGKGLGLNEQGDQKTVAEIVENISREGLGGPSANILGEVQTILQEFAKSEKLSILAFDPTFTKEERAQIHKMAMKYNLKGKSEGKGENRRITISRKFNMMDLIKNLLREDGETPAYKLIIPKKFAHLWKTESNSSNLVTFDEDSDDE